MKLSTIYTFLFIFLFSPISSIYAQSSLLNSEENIWLDSRNNTISVIPERNNPPFSFNDSSYISQGIFIDYIKLVSEKLDIKIDFMTARTRSDILLGMSDSKVEYISTLEVDKLNNSLVVFSEPYSTFPIVIAVRKDYESREGMTLDNFNNRSVAVVKDSPTSLYIKQNYPRVIIDEVVDNELALQKVALNEVDAAVINSASLTYLLSKQSMRSIKVVGSLSLDSKMAFVAPKDKVIIHSILAKGLKQISAKEHQGIIDKWIFLPNEKDTRSTLTIYLNDNINFVVILFLTIVIVVFIIILLKKHNPRFRNRYAKKTDEINGLEEEIIELEHTSANLIEELKDVKNLEQDIKEKMKNIKG